MDHFKILKRAYGITWNYRVLWVFGILLALTTASPQGPGSPSDGSGGGGGNGSGGILPPGNFQLPELSQAWTNGLIAIGIGLACLILLFIVLGFILRYGSDGSHPHSRSQRGDGRGRHAAGSARACRPCGFSGRSVGLGGLVVFLLLLLIAAGPAGLAGRASR
jgi:hypothetical protein